MTCQARDDAFLQKIQEPVHLDDAHMLRDDEGLLPSNGRKQRRGGNTRREAVRVHHVVLLDKPSDGVPCRRQGQGGVDLEPSLKSVPNRHPHVAGRGWTRPARIVRGEPCDLVSESLPAHLERLGRKFNAAHVWRLVVADEQNSHGSDRPDQPM